MFPSAISHDASVTSSRAATSQGPIVVGSVASPPRFTEEGSVTLPRSCGEVDFKIGIFDCIVGICCPGVEIYLPEMYEIKMESNPIKMYLVRHKIKALKTYFNAKLGKNDERYVIAPKYSNRIWLT